MGSVLDFHMLYLAGSIGADSMIVHPTPPSYVERGLYEAGLFRECQAEQRSSFSYPVSSVKLLPLMGLHWLRGLS